MAFHSLFAPKDPLDKALYDYIHSILGFYPKNISLYRVAFTHKSMAEETVGHYRVSNERMEYLGDAVLSVAVADFLFHTYPTQPEGFLTEMRSRIVSRSSLNKLSQKLGFENYIRHAPNTGNGMSFKSVGGNAFEALMGAIYLDRGFEFAKRSSSSASSGYISMWTSCSIPKSTSRASCWNGHKGNTSTWNTN